jgi:hypothetical protein
MRPNWGSGSERERGCHRRTRMCGHVNLAMSLIVPARHTPQAIDDWGMTLSGSCFQYVTIFNFHG